MAEGLIITRAESQTAGIPGRSLNTVRNHHFVIDEPAYGGGPGEEITPAEAFLAGVSACGVLLVDAFAREAGWPLAWARAAIEGVRLGDDPANFKEVNLKFELAGVTQEQAEALVERYKNR